MVITDNALIVLDGATAHDPAMPSAGEYVDCLASELARSIGDASPLAEILKRSISRTTESLGIVPGLAPSSTVALVRVESDTVDALILGDTSVIVGQRGGDIATYTDDRLSQLDLPEADLYRRFLALGWGYTGRHGKILEELQVAERARRNRPRGYWIAEADPSAAEHAVHVQFARDELSWIVVATDGAFDLMPALGLGWHEVARMSTPQLGELLDRIHTWEAEIDPEGKALPRAKRHDDKTIAIVRFR
ncbi:PP2C family serine/threonine-protein phosphatase [Nocardia sp. NPDC058519]|uniref:PP2C family serine/threonine-protein phosphatase n=1 Tax=Nocardia sp. NPDC058519 TaxID=3346535 RepID=UPI00365CB5BD